MGSNDFYLAYCAQNGKVVTLDTGHFHPTEVVADKVSSVLLFCPEIMLHVSRPMRWDSDHVTLMDESTLELCMEIVRCNALGRVHIGLDYFDASINRIGAYVIGARATQKSVLRGLLEPVKMLSDIETPARASRNSPFSKKANRFLSVRYGICSACATMCLPVSGSFPK